MYVVKRIDAVSWAKAYTLAVTAVMAVILALIGLPLIIFGILAASASDEPEAMLIVPIAGFIALAYVAAMIIFVFIFSLVQAAVFSWALGRIGGLKLDIDLADQPPPPALPAEPLPAEPMPPAPAPEPTPEPEVTRPPAEPPALESPVVAPTEPMPAMPPMTDTPPEPPAAPAAGWGSAPTPPPPETEEGPS